MSPSLKGIVHLVMSNVAFCTMVCIVKLLSDYNVYTTTSIRFIIGIVVVVALVLTGYDSLTFRNKSGLVARGLLGGLAILISYLSIVKLGVVKSSILFYTYPLFASVLGVLLLKEKLTYVKVAAIGIAFTGMVLTIFKCKVPGSSSLFHFGVFELISIAGAILSGLAVVFVKQLQKTESTSTIFLAQCLGGLLIVVFPAGTGNVDIPPLMLVLMVIAGLLAAIGQLLFTRAYSYITVSTGAVFIMLAPVFNMISGVIIFREELTLQMLIGAISIIGACCLLLIPEPLAGKMMDKSIPGLVKK